MATARFTFIGTVFAIETGAWPPLPYAAKPFVIVTFFRSAKSFLPIRPYGIVDPHLNRACVKAIVVVVAAAVLAAVADVGYESLRRAAGLRIQENATA
jgi:hypothetical protein